MTQVDVTYHYNTPPRERSILALSSVREVYGIRRVALDERAGTITIEYDATRLAEPTVRQLVRRAGLEIIDRPAADLSIDDVAAEQAEIAKA